MAAVFCVDDDASAKQQSGGVLESCADAGKKDLCGQDSKIGDLVREVCPLTCGECQPGDIVMAYIVMAYIVMVCGECQPGD